MIASGKRRLLLFEELHQRIIRSRQIQVIVGPRQVGKTTLMKHLIDKLIGTDKVPPRRILYLSFDHPLLRLSAASPLDAALALMQENLGEKLREQSQPVYVFLDGVQKLPDWGDVVKHWHELRLPIRFILSGSSSLQLLKGSGESLLGRIDVKIILPLSFKERLLWNLDWNPQPLQLEWNSLKDLYGATSLEHDPIQRQLEEHLLLGGYPALLDEYQTKTIEEKQKLLNDYKTLTFERDIYELENIRDTTAVDGLFTLIAQSTSSKVNFSKFSSVLGIKNDSVKRYCGLLASTFLVKMSHAYSKSKVINLRKDKKIYTLDCGLRNAVLLQPRPTETEMGYLAESTVAAHLCNLSYRYSLSPNLFYWQDASGREVDLVWTYGAIPLPIEVKFQNAIRGEDLSHIIYFMKNHKLTKGVVVTKNQMTPFTLDGLQILQIPMWLFLLIDGI